MTNTRPRTSVLLAAAMLALACVGGEDKPMRGMEMPDAPIPPPVMGYAEGEEIAFLHTEASDSAVAKMLTDMMHSPVPLVPALSRVPDGARAAVFVFRNGVQPQGPRGPFGFQPDVFDCMPSAPCYSPLRTVSLVHWLTPEEARVRRSADEVKEAEGRGLLRIERTNVVVNMPVIRWPGGKR